MKSITTIGAFQAKRGRPRKSEGSRAIQTQVRLNEEELHAIILAAEKEGFNISQWIRYAIRQHLKTQGIEIREPDAVTTQQG